VSAERRPNVLFILADDMGWGDLGCRLAVRDGRWKLLLNPDRNRVELYDITDDSTELENLAAREPDVVSRLADRALAWGAGLPPGPVAP
jgi:arylsulfatase A-like enzyme